MPSTPATSKKPDFSLIPYHALYVEAEAFGVGIEKHGEFNYMNGTWTNRAHAAAAIRHVYKYLSGEDRCPVDGQHHLGAARARLAMILHAEEQGILIDNRFNKTK